VDPVYFSDPDSFRAWLEENHGSAQELWVGCYKKATGKASMSWSESVDQALCFGWIDGLRRSVDGERYTIRFTPRRPGSHWSALNIRKVDALTEAGLMRPAGERAFAALLPHRAAASAFEQEEVAFEEAQAEAFQANADAWRFFQSQPPGYRKTATWWVISAKRASTRARRLETLIADSEAGCRIKQLRR